MMDAHSHVDTRFQGNAVTSTGGSMSPFILPGSRLFVERVPVKRIQKGDVVCYIGEGALGVAHRVVSVNEVDGRTILCTRGDAQIGEERVPAEAVISVVRRVEHKLLSYDTDGPVGRAFARIALGEDRTARAAKTLCWLSFRALAVAKRTLNKFI
jgi:signal peptidase I